MPSELSQLSVNPDTPKRVDSPRPLILSRRRKHQALPESRVFEITHMRELEDIISLLPPGSLIAKDLDNTIMEPTQLIGSDQWFETKYKELLELHANDKVKVHAELIPLYNAIQTQTAVQAVEPHTPLIIARLQKKHKVCGLTTRGKELVETTERQLASIDVDFNRPSVHQNRAIDLAHIGHASKIDNSIIYAGGRDKGACLIEFMRSMQYDSSNTPHIVFVDDKPHHIEKVKAAAKQLGIKYTGIRYAHLDEKIKRVDKHIATIQQRHFTEHGELISDQEAAERISAKQAQPKRKKLRT